MINGVANTRHVWRLCEIVRVHPGISCRPDEDIVGEMPCNSVRDLLTRGEAFTQEGDVLVVPGVAVRNRRPIADAINLIAIIPPGHHPRICRSALLEPPVRLSIVIEDNLLTIR